MNKFFLWILFTLLSALPLSAQEAYYASLNDSLRCQQLKTALKQLISAGYIERSYSDARFFMEANDTRRSDDGLRTIIWDMYSDNPTGPEPYEYRLAQFCSGQNTSAEGACWNREHCLPASWFKDTTPEFSDIINLVPSDAFVNNRRANNPYGKVGTATFTSQNGGKLGSSSTTGVNGIVFEPIDAYKGDFARIMLYMITRYEDKIRSWGDPDGNRVIGNDPFLGFTRPYLDLMLQWHEQDPPSDKERARNQAAELYQKNRNPFVDRPEYATRIWQTSEQDCQNFSVNVSNLSYLPVRLYPNPVRNERIMADFVENGPYLLRIIDISGKVVIENVENEPGISTQSLGAGIYFLYISNGEKHMTGKFSVIR